MDVSKVHICFEAFLYSISLLISTFVGQIMMSLARMNLPLETEQWQMSMIKEGLMLSKLGSGSTNLRQNQACMELKHNFQYFVLEAIDILQQMHIWRATNTLPSPSPRSYYSLWLCTKFKASQYVRKLLVDKYCILLYKTQG